MGRTRDIPLKDARELIQRAIDKAEQLGLRGGIAVYGASGALVSVSRLDRGGAGGMARARSKAWISATQQIPSAEHLGRMNFVSAPVEQGFKTASPEALFPGAGGMPIFASLIESGEDAAAEVIGGIAASGATVSPFFPAGVPHENMIADGKPANPEDLLIHYALGIPYVGQHGDDVARWDRSFGPFPDDAPAGLGMAPAPRASAQTEHDWAIRVADLAIAEARSRGVLASIAIVDHRGDAIQQDAMDGAATSGAFLALALAATSATFQLPSAELATRYPDASTRRELAASLPFPILADAGGVPILEDGQVVAGLAVAGVGPELGAEIAAAAVAAIEREL